MREKLSQAFHVEIVRFHDPKVARGIRPAGLARRRWPTWCCANAVRRSHSERLDRPGVQRRGGHGALAGRVASRVDRRPRRPSPAGTAGRAQDWQVLDDRRWDKGSAQLEVVAEARGILPTLDRLLQIGDGSLPGFRIGRVQDQGLEAEVARYG